MLVRIVSRTFDVSDILKLLAVCLWAALVAQFIAANPDVFAVIPYIGSFVWYSAEASKGVFLYVFLISFFISIFSFYERQADRKAELKILLRYSMVAALVLGSMMFIFLFAMRINGTGNRLFWISLLVNGFEMSIIFYAISRKEFLEKSVSDWQKNLLLSFLVLLLWLMFFKVPEFSTYNNGGYPRYQRVFKVDAFFQSWWIYFGGSILSALPLFIGYLKAKQVTQK